MGALSSSRYRGCAAIILQDTGTSPPADLPGIGERLDSTRVAPHHGPVGGRAGCHVNATLIVDLLAGRPAAGIAVEPDGRQQASAPACDSSGGPVEHLVVIFLENRSFDHFRGRFPDARGRAMPAPANKLNACAFKQGP
jgi:phospholipase C